MKSPARSRATRAALAVLALGLIVPASLAAQAAPRAPEKPPTTFKVQTNEELQPTALPALPAGMTTDMLVEGDRIFHGKGGCFACHGAEAQGLPAAGDGITTALFYARHEWRSIDSLITAGIPDALTRSPIAMPARGARGDLTAEEIQRVAAYVWAINGVRGEPWPGGHASHGGLVPPGSTKGTAPSQPMRAREMPATPSAGQRTGTARSTNHAERKP